MRRRSGLACCGQACWRRWRRGWPAACSRVCCSPRWAAPMAALIALGMVGFLAAVTQAPLTAFIIVMEMVDGHSMVLSLMACALVSTAVSRVISAPLYPGLARMQAPPREALAEIHA